ncbi:MAG: acyltransferase family protein [Litoreibacter sp.]|nr:acyltransferase family protein [Litoreibacter sp.]
MTYRPEIDGLRAIAVLAVIFFHAQFDFFSGGFVGVDIFFVISGFLITSIIAGQLEQGRFSLLTFYQRRVRRIFPALFFVILCCLPFAWFWLMPQDLVDFAKSVGSVIAFVSNFWFWDQSGYFDTVAELKPLLHTWSLAVEEQFYLFVPLLFMLLFSRRRTVLVLVVVALAVSSFALSIWGVRQAQSATFYLLPGRAWELLVGSLLALWPPSLVKPHRTGVANAMATLGIGLVGVPIFVFDATTPFPGPNAIFPVFGTALILLFARPGTLVFQALSWRPFVWLGLISYSAYLWHQPVFAFFRHRFGFDAFDEARLWLIILTLGLAALSYFLVERPFRLRASVKVLMTSVAASGAACIALGVALYEVAREDPQQLPSYQWAQANAPATWLAYHQRKNVRRACTSVQDTEDLAVCSFGAEGAVPSLVLWGDSFAGVFLHGLHVASEEAGLAGTAIIADGCPPVLGVRNTLHSPCDGGTHTRALERIEAMSGVETVLILGNLAAVLSASNVEIDGNAATPEVLQEKVRLTVERLHRRGIKTVMMEQGPRFERPVVDVLLQQFRNGLNTPPTVARAQFLSHVAPVRALGPLLASYVGVDALFCDATHCPSVDRNGVLVTYDEGHLTKAYSEKLANYVFQNAQLAR